MSVCGKCNLAVNRTNQDKILCAGCNSYFHISCVNLSKNDLEFMGNKKWHCDRCVSERRRLQCDDSPVRGGTSLGLLTREDVRVLLSEMTADILNGQKILRDELNELSRLFHEQIEINKDQKRHIEVLRLENADLKLKCKDIQLRLDDLEQYGRRNTLEFHGVPVQRDEDVVQTVSKVCNALGENNFDATSIDACHRLSSKNGKTPAIIVRFVRRVDADRLLSAKRSINNFSTKHIGMPDDSRIYVNLSLCKSRRVLLGMARKAVREGALRQVWVDRVGRIKVKVADGEAGKTINDEDDLVKEINASRCG